MEASPSDLKKRKTKLFGGEDLFTIRVINYIHASEKVASIVKKYFPQHVVKTTHGISVSSHLTTSLKLLSDVMNDVCIQLEDKTKTMEADIGKEIKSLETILKREKDHLRMKVEILMHYVSKLPVEEAHELFWRTMKYVRDKEIAKELAMAFFR